MKRETAIDSVIMRAPEGLSHERQQSHRDQRDAFPNTYGSHLIPRAHKSPAPQPNNYFLFVPPRKTDKGREPCLWTS